MEIPIYKSHPVTSVLQNQAFPNKAVFPNFPQTCITLLLPVAPCSSPICLHWNTPLKKKEITHIHSKFPPTILPHVDGPLCSFLSAQFLTHSSNPVSSRDSPKHQGIPRIAMRHLAILMPPLWKGFCLLLSGLRNYSEPPEGPSCSLFSQSLYTALDTKGKAAGTHWMVWRKNLISFLILESLLTLISTTHIFP